MRKEIELKPGEQEMAGESTKWLIYRRINSDVHLV